MNSSSSSCKNYSIALGNVSTFSMDSLVALASIPSSGNTWVRSIIEEATGVFTGSMYEDKSLADKGFYGELLPWNSGSTLVIKTHGFTTGKGANPSFSFEEQSKYNHMEKLTGKVILLLRTP